MLARWAGWGATPTVFDEARTEFATQRAELQQLLSPAQYRAAARTTLNAHYTDAALATATWDALQRAGFGQTAGRVLEPGCGAGTFLGFAPDSAQQMVGVELDPTSGAIAAALYPHAAIRVESFADTQLAEDSFDLTIGNVPFGSTTLHDKTHNRGRHSMHNHFLIKSLHLTRPGGVVAVLTSHWTMDATNPAARREIDELAELVTAIRLPGTAHQRAAGTTVVTDLLVLRRRDERPVAGAEQGSGWERTVVVGGDAGRTVAINEFFAAHPGQVIGTVRVRTGQFGPEIDVRAADDVDPATALADRLHTALSAYAHAGRSLFSAAARDTATPAPVNADVVAMEGHLSVDERGRFTVVAGGQLHPHQIPASQHHELRALLELRDIELALLHAEAATADDTPRITALRRDLNRSYDRYLARYGPINRVSTRRTGRIDPDTGQERLARIRPAQGRFRDDPHSPAVYALEHYDAALGTAAKASIFTERAVAPRAPRLGADTAEDAVAICLDTHGRVELAEVARLLGRTGTEARDALGDLVFDDPEEPTRLLPASEYLSGNVRTKLAAARAAAGRDGIDRWSANIAALAAVQPVDLAADDISVRLGASWISADVVADFLTEMLDDTTIRVEHPGGSTWTVRGQHHTVLASSTFGTARGSAVMLAQAVLEQRAVKIYDEPEPGMRVINLTETVAAQEKRLSRVS